MIADVVTTGIDGNTIGVIIGSIVTLSVAFIGLGKIMLSQATKDREADRKERKELSGAIRLMAKNSSKVATATEHSAQEAKDRNGHLANASKDIANMVNEGNKLTVSILSTLTKSAIVLAKDTKDAATHVKEVKVSLEQDK